MREINRMLAVERELEAAAARAYREWDDHARMHAGIAACQSAGRGSRGS